TNGSQTSLIVDFDLKTDPNTDLVLTQSRQQLANGQLPPEVTSYGISFESRPPLPSCWSAYTRPTAPATLRFSLTMRTSTSTTPSAAPLASPRRTSSTRPRCPTAPGRSPTSGATGPLCPR